MRVALGLLLLIALASSDAFAVWGTGSFENEYAMDWVAKLTRTSNTKLVYRTLEDTRKQSFIGERSADTAIAAAEVVAAMLDRPSPALPAELTAWVKARAQRPTGSQVQLARDVLLRVLDPKTSELAAFWPDTDPEGWRKEVTGLLDRLLATGANVPGLSNNPIVCVRRTNNDAEVGWRERVR